MKHLFRNAGVMVAVIAALASCSKNNDYNNHGGEAPPPTINKVVISGAGDSTAVAAKLDEFRTLAGNPLNGAPGATTGRREVNWDGVPANFTNNNTYPFDFFGSFDATVGNARKRGLIMNTTGSFRLDSTDFSEVDPSYGDQFTAFSKKKLFASIGSNVTEVTFKVAGTNTDAFVKSFGVIFSDVDVINLTTVEYFNGNTSLGIFKAQPSAQGFSFVG